MSETTISRGYPLDPAPTLTDTTINAAKAYRVAREDFDETLVVGELTAALTQSYVLRSTLEALINQLVLDTHPVER